MAQRPVFIVKEKYPFYHLYSLTFTYYSGFSKAQKQKNILSLHEEFGRTVLGREGKKIAEISSKSLDPETVKLSAFKLKKFVPSLNKSVPVECVFQAGKVFSNGGPYLDLLEASPVKAKKDGRLRNSGRLIAFEFEDIRYPLEPKTIFYDWIYMNACLENPEISDYLLQFDAFTDIEFNPEKSINCQARSCAIYVALHRMDLTDRIKDFESYKSLIESDS